MPFNIEMRGHLISNTLSRSDTFKIFFILLFRLVKYTFSPFSLSLVYVLTKLPIPALQIKSNFDISIVKLFSIFSNTSLASLVLEESSFPVRLTI